MGLRQAIGGLWAWWNGDLAYRRYLDHQAQAHPEVEPATRQAFYLATIERRYNSVNRCC